MSGFQAFNSAGALTVDGTNKPAMISQYKQITSVTDYGYYQIESPFTTNGGYDLGFLPENFYPNVSTRWVRMNSGKYCFPGADQFQPNSGQMMISTQSLTVSSGYLDVYNESGSLIWSAVSAASVPRILDFIDIPPGYDLQNNTYVKSLSYNPWFLQNACPGNISDDGTVTGYSGVCIRWTGSQIQVRYISKLQNTYNTALGSVGLRIPLAYITGY